MRNGVPFDVAFSLDATRVLAFSIIFGQFEGGTWSWSRMEWEAPR